MAPGGIGLLHDTPAEGTVDADRLKGLIEKEALAKVLIEEMGRRGLEPVSLDELLSAGQPVRRAKVVR
jgi:hypothetical protein